MEGSRWKRQFRVQKCRVLQSPGHQVPGSLSSLPFPGHPETLQGSCEGEVLLGWGLWWVGCHVVDLPELALASPHLLRPSGEAFMGCQIKNLLLSWLHLPCPSLFWPGTTTSCSDNTYGFGIATPVLTEPHISGRALGRPRPVLGHS